MDLVRVSLSVLVGQLPWLVLWLFVAVALIYGERRLARSLPRGGRRSIHGAGWGVGVALGLWFAFGTLWLCDDAYISFRYARNFADGHGLVFNVGEWVEGYTNFLWTLILGIAGRAGGDIPLVGLLGNLASFVVALIFVAAAVRRMAPSPVVLPFAAVALAASRPFYTFASSGLETMPAAMWVAVGIWASALHRGPFLSGLAFTLAALTRPDHVLIYGCMGLAFVAEDWLHHKGEPWFERLQWRRAFAYAAPFVLLYVPYFLWRWHAYGDFFPNTYYAKSGGETYYRQGIVYLGHFFWTSGAFAWLPILALALWGRSRARSETRMRLFALLALPLFGHYVVKVGGDFMEHRFFLSLLPIAAVALETGLRWRFAERGAARSIGWMVAGGLAFAAAVVPVRILEPWQKRWHLADESSFYRVKSIFPLEIASGYMDKGLRLRRALTDAGVTPPISGDSIGLLGYYSGLPIVDAFGLVNRRVAHKPIEKRGRPGHEKFATLEELIEEGAVVETRGNPWGPFGNLAEGRVGAVSFHLLRWDPHWAAELRKLPGARIPDPLSHLERLAKGASGGEPLGTVSFYRSFLGEEGRSALAKLEGKVREGLRDDSGGDRIQLLRLAEELLPAGDPELAAVISNLAARWDFEGAVGDLEFEGSAFGKGPVKGAVKGQSPVAGFQGSQFLNSMHGGDRSRGAVRFPVFELQGQPIHLLVGGGRNCNKVYVGLEVEGEIVSRVCGKNDEVLRPATLSTEGHEGKRGRLVAVDGATGGWGHILVDDVIF